jgi:oligopeptide/dipeptide ABC transporter ATP-binding protein
MTLLDVRHISKTFDGQNGAKVQAVSDVSFSMNEGEVLGVVGESGCGKSTLGQTILRLIEPDSGEVVFRGIDLAKASKTQLNLCRRDIQIIFQDPFGSLNPRHKVGYIIREPLIVHRINNRAEQEARVAELFDLVGLPKDSGDRYPHEFSGGQRQRIAIARALALNPKLIIADESVSALDVSIQSQILNLIADLRQKLGLSIIFISHDLSVIRHLSDRIAVMYLGQIVEIGTASQIIQNPRHPYTKALLAAVPKIGRDHASRADKSAKQIVVTGEPPDPANPPPGCAFHSRCPEALDICRSIRPDLIDIAGHSPEELDGVKTACHLHTN